MMESFKEYENRINCSVDNNWIRSRGIYRQRKKVHLKFDSRHVNFITQQQTDLRIEWKIGSFFVRLSELPNTFFSFRKTHDAFHDCYASNGFCKIFKVIHNE